MNSRFFFLFCFLFCLGCSVQPHTYELVLDHTLEEKGKYQVLFPQNPTYEQSEENGFLIHNYHYFSNSHVMEFSLVYVEIPSLLQSSEQDIKRFVDAASIIDDQYTIVSKEDISQEAMSGIELVYSGEHAATTRVFRHRLMVIEDRFYQLISSHQKEYANVATTKFFDSFSWT